MDRGTTNVPHLLAQYLFRHAEGRKSRARLLGGHFIGRLAMHFGLVSDEGLRGLQDRGRKKEKEDADDLQHDVVACEEALLRALLSSSLDNRLDWIDYSRSRFLREVKRLKRSRIPLVKVRWNSKRGPEFTWEREDQFKKKYPHLFTKTTPSSSAAS
ncbi:hypothetical protein Tco_0051246 [Tanacetum coccineum]